MTNVFLRDLNVALVVEAMMRGAKSVYVDFVDYDEIAHHCGVTRAESLAALYGLDEALHSLEQVIDSGITPRPYHIVLVSDHGQSQGATFLQRYGQSLEDFIVERLSGEADGHGGHGRGRGMGAGQHAPRAAVAARTRCPGGSPRRRSPTATRTPPSAVSGVVEDTTGAGRTSRPSSPSSARATSAASGSPSSRDRLAAVESSG